MHRKVFPPLPQGHLPGAGCLHCFYLHWWQKKGGSGATEEAAGTSFSDCDDLFDFIQGRQEKWTKLDKTIKIQVSGIEICRLGEGVAGWEETRHGLKATLTECLEKPRTGMSQVLKKRLQNVPQLHPALCFPANFGSQELFSPWFISEALWL